MDAVPGRCQQPAGLTRREPVPSALLCPAAGIHRPRGCPGPGATRYLGGCRAEAARGHRAGTDVAGHGARWLTLTVGHCSKCWAQAACPAGLPQGADTHRAAMLLHRDSRFPGCLPGDTGAVIAITCPWPRPGGRGCRAVVVSVQRRGHEWGRGARLLLSSAAPSCPGSPRRSRKPKRRRSLVRDQPMKRRWRRLQRWPGWS